MPTEQLPKDTGIRKGAYRGHLFAKGSLKNLS